MRKCHLIVANDRYRCGKRPQWNSLHSNRINEVTCRPCLEAHRYENGYIREYRMGGSYTKDGEVRKHQNHLTYKEEIKQLQSQLEQKDKRIKVLEDACWDVIKYIGDERAIDERLEQALAKSKELKNDSMEY